VAPYLYSRFRIFNRLVLEEYVFQVKGSPHLLKSCLCVVRYSFPFTARKMHLFFRVWLLSALEATNILDGHPLWHIF